MQLIVEIVLQVIGGLGLFLLGMKFMSEGMQNAAGDRLRKMIGAVTNNRLSGVTMGLAITCLIQSSSITTVMTVGLVNSGVMTLRQAVGVIFGSNIGTTITGWILVLKISQYGLPLLGAAALCYLFSRREYPRFFAMAVMGVGMVFFGLELMKEGFEPLKDHPEFEVWFRKFEATSYLGVWKCVLVGCALTLIVQSSSATLGITIALTATGVIQFQTGAALILGENIGTTITAYLASLGASTSAKRAAYAHCAFNLIGVLWITAVFFPYMDLIKLVLGADPGTVEHLASGAIQRPHATAGLALVHTGFNVANTLISIPLVPTYVRLLTRWVPERKQETRRLTRLTDATLLTPEVAVEQSEAEIHRMGDRVVELMDELRTELGPREGDEGLTNAIFQGEQELDVLQHEVSVFLAMVLSGTVTRHVSLLARRQLRIADEYESISDHIAQILKLHIRMRKSDDRFPDEEMQDIVELHDAVRDYLQIVNDAVKADEQTILNKAHPKSTAISFKVRDVRNRNLDRLGQSGQKPELIMLFSDMLADYRRIKAHALNVAEVVAGEK